MTTAVTTPPAVIALQPWVDAGVFGPAEVHAAGVVADVLGREPATSVIALSCALAVWAPQRGHACIELDTIAGIVDRAIAVAAADAGEGATAEPSSLPWPQPIDWLVALRGSAAVREVAEVDREVVLDERPLVLFGRRVYTQRQWVDECAVAEALRTRGGRTVEPTASPEVLAHLLEGDQRAAASTASARLLTVIAGGPGSGKTHTIAALLAAELAGVPGLRVALAAPTGKAASRLTEAAASTGLEATTVHRLLRRDPNNSTRFRHDADNPLELDLLVVDETSMLALPLTARLLDAVPVDCRLVLVGDPDQLNSIEVGAVLADVVASGERGGAPAGGVIRLIRQHRTAADSPVAPLAEAIRLGDADAAVDLLRQAGDPRLQFVEIADGTMSAEAADAIFGALGPAYSAARRAATAGDRSAAFTSAVAARILCAHRRGPFGVAAWNDLVEAHLAGVAGVASGATFVGRPLLATRNDPRTGLANGDPGVLVRADDAARAVFRRGSELVAFDLAELDAVDTAYALTVHKSQGSQYDAVALVHPPSTSPLVSRELLYTAVTRTSSRLLVVASVAAIRRAVTTPTRRVTGLAEALSASPHHDAATL